ncbi:hypothetical protein OKW46_001386 [Paraburkholderia sp. WSM4179]|nr:hypothetical protein [Paraburkholderia sp. WSM4179]
MPNVLDAIADHPRPNDLATWWSRQDRDQMAAAPLEDEEQAYLDVYTSDSVPRELRIGQGIADPITLTSEDLERARRLFGDSFAQRTQFCNRENRRRIVAHYIYTHPATIAYALNLYRLTRDVVPPLFILERIYELFSGEEAFTGTKISRINAAVDLAIPIVAMRLLRLARAGLTVVEPKGPRRLLTDTIWDLPPEGGGIRINDRWYTEHALERMAPDTAEIRALMRTRAGERLRRIGIVEGSTEWNLCLKRALEKINPRGVPPSVVEAEIAQRGSTSVRVITAYRGQVVITVIPRH